MIDYGRPVEFGFFPSPVADDHRSIVEQVMIAEDAGLELIGVQDHPYQRRFLDTFSLISDLAARTTNVRLFPDVANLPLRPPALLAKVAASIDRMSGGRFELGLGAGAFWDAIEAMGGPRRSPADAVEALTEAIEVIRLMWSGERGLRFEGRHYRLEGVHSGPVPAHDIGIWIGALGPRMLALTAGSPTAGSRLRVWLLLPGCSSYTSASTRPRGTQVDHPEMSVASTTCRESLPAAPATATSTVRRRTGSMS
jgi:alkanesulfonate monooxygenase SsuD/methylene tetrahydromethanopterin reductase-like flavin-dependent oxidoreductase (luciferase family)